MNYKMVLSILGKVLLLEGLLMIFPMLVGIYYKEGNYLSFLLPMAALLVVGVPLASIKKRDNAMYAKEGFVIVAASWIIMSLIGALPFVISGAISSFVDAFFETVSGFTTTGATILSDIEALPRAILFWRSLTHFIGGMGILVFVLAILPNYDSGTMHVFRAEAPGPSADRLVSKLSFTARILYGIYMALAVIEIIMLYCGGMPIFDSVVHTFGTAGTGGFSIKNASIAHYNSAYIEIVIAVFMFLFGVNFNVYYLILIGNFKKVLKSEELRVYLFIVIAFTFAIAVNILSTCVNFAEALRYSFFQVSSISSTTGFVTADFDKWPAFSKSLIVVLMIIGSCGGSTGGGIKVSRLIILIKSIVADIKRMLHPRSVVSVKFEGELLNKDTERNVRTFFVLWVLIVALCTMILCLDVDDFFVNFTATLSCIGNIGPGLSNAGIEMVGPMFNFGGYSVFSKVLLSFTMLFGRLEIFPIIIIFAPRTWRKG